MGATVPLSGFGRADDIWTQDIQTLKILEELTTGLAAHLPRYLDLNQIKHLILLQMMKGTKLTSNYVLRRAITIDHVQFTINIAFRYSSISQVVFE
ncbi:MAG: hypothetical protein ACRD5J_04540 [Nitrososphaeraceae archaeon]